MDNILVEEKMKNLNAKQEEIIIILKDINLNLNILNNRMLVLETKNGNKVEELARDFTEINSRLLKLEVSTSGLMSTSTKVLDSFIKLAIGVGLAWLIWKLGIKP